MASSMAKTDPVGPPKPKSRLLLMKERLKSQRQKQIQNLDKSNLTKESSTVTTRDANARASSVAEAAVSTTSSAISVASVSNAVAVSASPVRGRRFQRLKADEASSSRSKSNVRSELVHENIAGCMKRRASTSKSQEIKPERSLPSQEPVHPKQPSTPSTEVEESGRGGGLEVGGKFCRKGSLLARSQSFLARLSGRGQIHKEKSSVTSLTKANTEPVATGSSSEIDAHHDNASATHPNHASHLFSQSVNSATNNTLIRSTGSVQHRQFLEKDSSKFTKDLPSQPSPAMSTEDAKIRLSNKQDILKLHSIFGADVKPAMKVCQSFNTGVDTAMKKSLTDVNALNGSVLEGDSLEQRKLLNPKGCQAVAVGCSKSQSHSSTDNDTVNIPDRDVCSSYYQSNGESQSGLDYREFAGVCNNQRLQTDGSSSTAVGRLELINSEKHSIPREICSCRCGDLNRKPVTGSLSSTSYSPCCIGLNPMFTTNAVCCESRQQRMQQNSVPMRPGPVMHSVVSRLSDIPEELTPCQVKSRQSDDVANVATDINRNVSEANRNMAFNGSSSSSSLLANLPRRYLKKGRSGSLRSGSNQDQTMSDQKFRQCQSASVLPRSGHEPKLLTMANFPADSNTTVSLSTLMVDLDVSADNHTEGEERKAALFDHLAQKYPTHADAIRSPGGSIYDSGTIRRRNAAVMHGSQSSVHQMTDRMATSCCADADAGSPVSSSGLGSCRELRSTLPVIRSPNKSMERPLGQVFLVYHGETKRAVLPNEVTSIDTVRALFVRSFPRSLSMRWFDSPYRKIYILDSATNVFYELEDLGDIKDRVVLKIFEHSECMTLASPRALQQTRPIYDTLGRTTPHDLTTSVSSLGQSVSCTSPHEGMEKTHSLPPSVSSLQMYSSQQSVSLPPQCTTNPWSHIAPQCLSPSKGLPMNQRHSVACLPEPVSCNSSVSHMSQSHSYQDYTDRDIPLSAYSSGTVTPSSGDSETRNRMQKMESQLASLTAWVQTAMYKQGKTGVAIGDSTSSIHRSAIISAPNSVKSSVSDISTCTPQPVVSVTMLNIMCALRKQAQEVRSELCHLRRMQVAYADCIRTAVQDVFQKIKLAMDNVPDLRALPSSWTRRLNAQVHVQTYNLTADQINEGLRDLEKLVEEIRKDVVGRKCRVNMAEVESLALALSQISRSLADLKSGFPEVHDQMKSVMENEMEVVVHEEKFLREEPLRIEESLKRSKKLMGTLLTLKKLASVQEKRPVSIPTVATKHELSDDDRQAVLQNIEAMIPNHEARMQCLEEAAAARERKKKITGNVESLRFEKTLELAQRQLRETDNLARNAARQEQVLSLIYQQKSTRSEGAASKDDARSHTALHANQNSLSFSVSNGVNHLHNGGLNTGDEVSGMSVLSTGDARCTEPIQGKEILESRLCSSVSELSDVPVSVSRIEQSGKSEATKESADKNVLSDLSSGLGREELAAVAFLVSPTSKSGNETCELQKLVLSTKVTEIITNTKAAMSLSITNPPVDVFTVSSPGDGIINLSVPFSPNLSSTVAVLPSPVAKERVTFSKHVTEIPEGANDCQNRPKRIPPPPPPRKTVCCQGNTSGSSDNSTGSVYENVDRCKQDAAEQTMASTKMARPQSVFGLSRQSETVFMKPRPISEYVQGGFQSPLSKPSSATTSPVCFTNGNRAVLTKEPVVLVQASAVDELCCQKDSDSDSSTSADSQTGTIKRNPHSKDETPGDKKQQTQAGSNGSIARETSRLPPPVPLRKTSTLSSQNKMTLSPVAQHQYSNIQELRREHALLEKQQGGHAARKTLRSADSSLANGEIAQETRQARTNASQDSKTERRKCEETEIY